MKCGKKSMMSMAMILVVALMLFSFASCAAKQGPQGPAGADGKDGKAYLVINTSWEDTTTVELPRSAEAYVLTGNGSMRSRTMLLNGRELVLGENDELPDLSGEIVSGKLELAPGACAFILL